MSEVRLWLDSMPAAWASDECLPFPFCIGKTGYGYFRFEGRTQTAHRYVCAVHHGQPASNMDAAHSCGNKTCVNPRHLRWASRSENERDKRLHERDNRGERHGLSKLTAEQVLAIRNAQGFHREIAERFGISRQRVGEIKGGQEWTHL